MDSFIFPPTPLDSTDLTVTVVLAIVIVTMGLGNKLNIPLMGRSQGMMTYSKFAQEAGQIVPSFNVPSRLGMFLLYAPSVIVAFFTPTSTPRAILVMQLMVVHFGKRSLECLFLHRYSGTMPILSSVNILVAYAGFSWMNIYYAGLTPPLQTIDSVYPGLALFAVGELGNLYHHYCLRVLRKPGEKGYKVPAGGLFGFVAAPHYLFELVAWLGVAFCTQHVFSLVLWGGMCAYLFERAGAQDAWNREKLKDKYPKERKCIIPFVW